MWQMYASARHVAGLALIRAQRLLLKGYFILPDFLNLGCLFKSIATGRKKSNIPTPFPNNHQTKAKQQPNYSLFPSGTECLRMTHVFIIGRCSERRHAEQLGDCFLLFWSIFLSCFFMVSKLSFNYHLCPSSYTWHLKSIVLSAKLIIGARLPSVQS